MTEALRPLTLGEILDRTMQLYRRNFALFAGTAAAPMLVLLVCGVLAGVLFGVLSVTAHLALHSNSIGIAIVIVMALAIVLVAVAATVFTQAGVTGAAIGVIQGRKMKIREALAAVRPRFWRYCGLMILQGLFAAGIPGVAAAAVVVAVTLLERSGGIGPTLAGVVYFFAFLAAAVVAIVLGMAIAMGMAIAVAEDRPAVASLKRAIQLSKGTRGRIFVMFLVVWALTIVLLMIAYVPMIIVFVMIGVSGPNSPHTIAAILVAECLYLVIDFAIQTIVPPAYLTALVLFYYDQRIRKEGFDIELLMQHAGLGAPLAPPEPGPTPLPEAQPPTGEQTTEQA